MHLDQLADCPPGFLRAVDEPLALHVYFGPIVAVAVATRHTQGVAGRIEPRAWHQAVFDGLA